MVLLAGFMADWKFHGYPDDKDAKEPLMERAREDFDAFVKLWRTQKAREANWSKLSDEVKHILSDPIIWEEIESVADLLLERPCLDYHEVKLCVRFAAFQHVAPIDRESKNS